MKSAQVGRAASSATFYTSSDPWDCERQGQRVKDGAGIIENKNNALAWNSRSKDERKLKFHFLTICQLHETRMTARARLASRKRPLT